MHVSITAVLIMGALWNISIANDSDKVVIDVLEAKPDEEFVKNIYDAFEKANLIRLSYIPRQSLGRAPLSKEAILEGWEYRFSYRCPGSCKATAAKIQSYFSSGLRQAEQCPGPYYAALELLDRDSRVLVVYVDYTGRCFTIDETSYYTPMNFDDFVEQDNIYPDFVRP